MRKHVEEPVATGVAAGPGLGIIGGFDVSVYQRCESSGLV